LESGKSSSKKEEEEEKEEDESVTIDLPNCGSICQVCWLLGLGFFIVEDMEEA
jgi:hypothetical protein